MLKNFGKLNPMPQKIAELKLALQAIWNEICLMKQSIDLF